VVGRRDFPARAEVCERTHFGGPTCRHGHDGNSPSATGTGTLRAACQMQRLRTMASSRAPGKRHPGTMLVSATMRALPLMVWLFATCGVVKPAGKPEVASEPKSDDSGSRGRVEQTGLPPFAPAHSALEGGQGHGRD
jgi:hypothetical protein